MDFLKILNAFGAVLAWLIILATLWVLMPIFLKMLTLFGGR